MDELMESVEMPKLPENQKSYACIPEAEFLDEIDSYMARPENEKVEKVLHRLDEQYSKYRFMAFNLEAKKKKLNMQLPDLQLSLKMVEVLKKEEAERETQFCLSEQVYIKSMVPPTKTVYLWLGVNVMLEYPLDEAEDLLKKNLDAAVTNLKTVKHDQDFIRDQITTTEVNMARVYNWGVKQRVAKTEGASTSKAAA